MKKIVLFLIIFLVSLNVNAEDKKVTYYGLNNSDSITITLSDDNYRIYSKESSRIDIKEFNLYESLFKDGNVEEYPLYILKIDDEYIFSDFNKEKANTYILSTELLNVVTSKNATSISTCEAMFGYNFINLLKNNVFKILYIAIPLILIVYSTYDFAILTLSNGKDGLQGAYKKLIRRVFAAFLIFLVPNILIFLVNVLGSSEIETCINTFKNTQNIGEVN